MNKTSYQVSDADEYFEVKERLEVAQKLHYAIGDEINDLQDRINALSARLEQKRGELSDAQYQVKKALREKTKKLNKIAEAFEIINDINS